MSALGYEAGTLAPVIKCARCDKQARLTVENMPTGACCVCVDHAIAICHELGDSLGALMIAGKYRAL